MKIYSRDIEPYQWLNRMPLDEIEQMEEHLAQARSIMAQANAGLMLFGSIKTIKAHLKWKTQQLHKELAEIETAMEIQRELISRSPKSDSEKKMLLFNAGLKACGLGAQATARALF